MPRFLDLYDEDAAPQQVTQARPRAPAGGADLSQLFGPAGAGQGIGGGGGGGGGEEDGGIDWLGFVGSLLLGPEFAESRRKGRQLQASRRADARDFAENKRRADRQYERQLIREGKSIESTEATITSGKAATALAAEKFELAQKESRFKARQTVIEHEVGEDQKLYERNRDKLADKRQKKQDDRAFYQAEDDATYRAYMAQITRDQAEATIEGNNARLDASVRQEKIHGDKYRSEIIQRVILDDPKSLARIMSQVHLQAKGSDEYGNPLPEKWSGTPGDMPLPYQKLMWSAGIQLVKNHPAFEGMTFEEQVAFLKAELSAVTQKFVIGADGSLSPVTGGGFQDASAQAKRIAVKRVEKLFGPKGNTAMAQKETEAISKRGIVVELGEGKQLFLGGTILDSEAIGGGDPFGAGIDFSYGMPTDLLGRRRGIDGIDTERRDKDIKRSLSDFKAMTPSVQMSLLYNSAVQMENYGSLEPHWLKDGAWLRDPETANEVFQWTIGSETQARVIDEPRFWREFGAEFTTWEGAKLQRFDSSRIEAHNKARKGRQTLKVMHPGDDAPTGQSATQTMTPAGPGRGGAAGPRTPSPAPDQLQQIIERVRARRKEVKRGGAAGSPGKYPDPTPAELLEQMVSRARRPPSMEERLEEQRARARRKPPRSELRLPR